MSVEDNTRLVERCYAEAINGREGPACERLLSEDFVHNGEARGQAGQRGAVEAFLAAFDPLRHRIEIIFGAGNLVCAHQTWSGTHTGTFLDVPATGREVTFTSTAILRVAGDRISQAWDEVDMATLLARIGAP
jgi:predicted ester cyclase